MFISGFLFNAVIVLLYSGLNLESDSLVCGSNGATFYSQSNLCVFQGAATVAAFSWIEYWSVILALDSYLMVRRRAKDNSISFDERKETKKATSHVSYWCFRHLRISRLPALDCKQLWL